VEKVIFLLWGERTPEQGDELRDRLVGEVAPGLLADGVRWLSVNVHDTEAAAAPSPAPAPAGEEPHVAEVSVWLDCYEQAPAVAARLDPLGLRAEGYLVVESLYEDYGTTPHAGPRTWPDGERSPGVLTVALIHRPAGLEEREWITRWHGTQSPVSGRLQPRTRYVRNQVVRSLSPDAPQLGGIVEEGWPSAAHVADPMLFFNAGSAEELSDHVGQMMDSVSACLDLDRLRSATMSEYLLRTAPV
jgi:hypothetical protein